MYEINVVETRQEVFTAHENGSHVLVFSLLDF